MLHASQSDERLQKVNASKCSEVVRYYNDLLKPGTHQNKQEENMNFLPEGYFAMWSGWKYSAYNGDTMVKGDAPIRSFVDPDQEDLTVTQRDSVFEFEGDHVAFVILFHSVFAHVLLDYLPYISYLKDTMPVSVRFLFADSKTHDTKRLLGMQCQSASNVPCNNLLVHIRNGNLIVAHPKSSIRHMDHLVSARRWILESHPPNREALEQRTVV
jgi:hypothetical protein